MLSRVLIDVDGVLANSTKAFLEALGSGHTPDQVTDWDYCKCLGITEEQEAEAWRKVGEGDLNFDLYPGALDGVKNLQARGHSVVFVTAPQSLIPHWTHAREQWIARHFGDLPIIHTTHKSLIKGDCIIDDKPQNVIGWAELNPKAVGVLFAQPWNAGRKLFPVNVCRLNDWSVIAKVLT